MTLLHHARCYLGAIWLLGASYQSAVAQRYDPTITPVQYQGVPMGTIASLRPFQDLPSTFIPFNRENDTSLEPIFQEPPAALEPAPLGPAASDLPATGEDENKEVGLKELPASTQPRFHFGGLVQATYDSNVFIQQTKAQSDVEFVVAPTIAIGAGTFADSLQLQQQSILETQDFENADLIQAPNKPFYYLSYIPSYTAFVDHTGLNSFDNDVAGAVQVNLGRLTLGAFARFQTLRVADTEVGTRTLEEWTSARAYALYKLSDKTQLNAEVFLQNRDLQNFIGSFELWNENWVDYRYSGKTSLGIGVAEGLLTPTAGPREYYGRIQARATLNATKKISVAAKGGLELRGVSGAGAKFYPVFGLEGRYAITSHTLAGVSIYQQIRSSANVAAMVYTERGFNVSVQQQVLDHWQLSASLGYGHTEWDNSFLHVGIFRTDNFVYVSSSVQVALSRWVDSQLGVEFRKNESSLSGASFNEVLATWGVHLKF